MTQSKPDYEWSGERGRQWAQSIDGLEAMLAPVDTPLINALRLDHPCRIADIGCGGGRTSRAIAAAASDGSTVHGFDISPDLVALARSRGEDEALTFNVQDAGQAHVPNPAFDRLASRFGVMFFDDPQTAFRNLRGWLAPGGQLAFAVWAAPAQNPWFMDVKAVVEDLATLPPVEPDAPGPFRYAEMGVLKGLLESAGFEDVTASSWTGRLPIGDQPGAEAAARFSLSAFAAFKSALDEAGPDAYEQAVRLLADRFSGALEEGVVRVSAAVHIVSAKAAPR